MENTKMEIGIFVGDLNHVGFTIFETEMKKVAYHINSTEVTRHDWAHQLVNQMNIWFANCMTRNLKTGSNVPYQLLIQSRSS